MGTPEDIEKIIDAGHGKKIMATVWAVGTLRDGREVVEMYQAIHDPVTTHCVFFKDGLCTLHDLGLKPTEGKLSNHTVHKAAKIGKTLAFLVANEWTDKKNRETIERIEEKLQHSKNQ